MGRIMDNSGQGSAELILIIGGLLIIILLIGNYIATIQETVQESLKKEPNLNVGLNMQNMLVNDLNT